MKRTETDLQDDRDFWPGLTDEQVTLRMERGWDNRTRSTPMQTEGQIIAQNCFTFFNLVFMVLAALLLLAGSSPIKMTFLVVVVVNTVIGCIQQIRAKRAVDKLSLVAAQTVTAIRNGKPTPVRSELLVRDDIVEFSTGDQICADAVVRYGQVQVNEALVTGEADAVVKNPGDPLLSGSFVIAGKCRALLREVGDDCFAAKLAAEAKKDPKAAKSEMMRSLDKLIRVIGFALIPIGCILFWQEYRVLKLGLQVSAEATVAALVGMIPEGLYLLTSVAMAVSSLKLTKKRVLVQDMNCIESLARVDVLCVDKTGTITEPEMEVADIHPLTQDPPEYLESVLSALYGGREPENDTGKALSEIFRKVPDWVCQTYIPFTSETKWSGAVFQDHGAFLAGAPQFILGERYPEVREAVEGWAATGHRVLLVARYDGEPIPGKLDTGLVTPLALVMLTSRIRESAPETFAYFARQGVAVKVISGDDPLTVSQVAQRAGIPQADRYINAQALKTEEDFLDAAESYTVFGRVTPEKKRRLIRALKARKHTVAMTGDGVNDVLALKEADCSIAMASGAHAASQVARLVLLDNDFSAMPEIVGEGRRVINNIQRSAALFLVKNIFSLGLALLSMLTAMPYPLEPQHLSVISALTIGVPSFFLAMEPNYERVQGRFLPGVLRRAFPGGLTNLFVVLTAQAFMMAFSLPLEQISTVCTAILAVVGMLVLFQVCKPFDTFRKVIWAAMAVGLLGCFTLLGGIFELGIESLSVLLVMVTLLIMTPTVFFAVQRLFDWGDRLVGRLRRKETPHADL